MKRHQLRQDRHIAPRCGGRIALVLLLVSVLIVVFPREAGAEETQPPALFALIVGSNISVDKELAPLKYADDDAARYLDLFRLLGARTYLLSRLDDNTRRLHPQAAAEAAMPTRASLDRILAQLASDVTQARDRGIETLTYVIYAGHGNVENGEGYITLEDARITGTDLAQIVAKVPSSRVHVIVDACASYFLAYSRGPGGSRRPLTGFQDVPQLASDPRVGLLLSTSSRRESHEWDAFQGGVFSHEVRSGLYGAADADGDGQVTYREIAAFVARANAAVPNDKYRPDTHSRAPRGSETLLDLRTALRRRLIIDGAHAAHYYLEDARGIRLADVHNAAGQTLQLIRPPPNGPVYLRRVTDEMEFTLPAADEQVLLADLTGAEPRSQTRGAAQDSFNMLFSLPFDRDSVLAYREPAPPDADTPVRPRSWLSTRRALGIGAIGAGATGIGLAVYFATKAASEVDGVAATSSQADVARRNDRVATANTGAVIAAAAGGAAVVSGVTLLLWPTSHLQATASPRGMFFGYSSHF